MRNKYKDINSKYLQMISEILSYIGTIAIQVISFFGYIGIFVLMALESMIFPIPAELVMPFAGFLAAKKEMSFALIILFSSLGSLFGSLLSYYMGKYGGDKIVIRYGKYLLLDGSDLVKTKNWFRRKGEVTVFISRFIPVVRHLISIPAGIGKMKLSKFCFYTVIGATLWNTFLTYLGFLLGENWEVVKKYSEFISIPVAVIIIILICYFAYRHLKNKLKKKIM